MVRGEVLTVVFRSFEVRLVDSGTPGLKDDCGG